jgi:hypothetical protein
MFLSQKGGPIIIRTKDRRECIKLMIKCQGSHSLGVDHMLTYHPCLTLRRSKKKARLNRQALLLDQVSEDNALQCLGLYRDNLKLDREYHLLARIIQ